AGCDGEAIFELSSKDIILFRRHPECISARNLLKCSVAGIFLSGNRVGVELRTTGGMLVAEVVARAAQELDLRPGTEVYAAIKAAAFRRTGG
ncbi:MAG TPA: TOBE domain-containing protein, partial [Verrucomicrobiae bacterium]|nr:TOBE domain-containing protein [Verrucomicrobiae bacterium]